MRWSVLGLSQDLWHTSTMNFCDQIRIEHIVLNLIKSQLLSW